MLKTDFYTTNSKIEFNDFTEKILNDYKLAVLSRECSLLGRKEVLSGKAKFGVFGDGKELPQVVLNHFFKEGDFRAGYYRDQTILMAQKLLTPKQFFSVTHNADPALNRAFQYNFLTPYRQSHQHWVYAHDKTPQNNFPNHTVLHHIAHPVNG